MRAIRPLTLTGLTLWLGACQPQARRLLVLDEAAAQPAELDATARPWRDAGYRVEYRRYYPHLTRADLDRYHVVMVLGGRGPANAEDALDLGDLAILTEWTLRGGVVVLGYPPNGESGGGTGAAYDRWLMNQWLAWSGTGITIGDFALGSDASPGAPPAVSPVFTAGLRETGYVPFPAGANNGLLVDDDAQVLARAVGVAPAPGSRRAPTGRGGGVPVAAASRTDNGLVLVMSRAALGAVRQEDTLNRSGTRAFLIALARFTRRPAEWARIPPAGRRSPLRLTGGPRAVSGRAPRASPPPGVAVERLAQQTQPSLTATVEVPPWISRQGLRALVGDFPALPPTHPGGAAARLAALDSLTTLLDVGAFNVLLTNAHVAPLVDSVPGGRWERDALRAAWEQVASRLQTTSVRWIPLVTPRDLATRGDSAVESCPLDASLWARLVTGVRALARLAASHHELIPAVGLSLDETTRAWSSPPFCDAAWQAALSALVQDEVLSRVRSARLKDVPLVARYDSLLDGGLLAAYDSVVARVVVDRASALRADLHRGRRDLLFAVVLDRSPADWFTLSFIRGISEPAAPALVFSTDPRARARIAPSGAVDVLHVLRLDPGTVLESDEPGLSRALSGEQDGFWLGPAESLLAGPSDSLARLVRRIGKER